MGIQIPAGQKTLGDVVLLHQAVITTAAIDITVNGDVDEIVEVEFQGVFVNNGADAIWEVRPNADSATTSYDQHYLQWYDGSVATGVETVSGQTFTRGAWGGSYKFEGFARTTCYLKTGCWRYISGHFGWRSDYSNGKMYQCHRNAIWKDNSTNITSLRLAWRVAPASISGTLLVRKRFLG